MFRKHRILSKNYYSNLFYNLTFSFNTNVSMPMPVCIISAQPLLNGNRKGTLPPPLNHRHRLQEDGLQNATTVFKQ